MNNYKDKMFNSTPMVGGLRPNIREPLSESSNDISGIFDKASTPLMSPQAKNTTFRTPPRPSSFLSRRYSLSDVGATSVYNQQSALKNNGFQSPQHRHLSRFNSLNTSTQLDTQSPGYVGRVVRYSEEREKLLPTHQAKYGGVGVFPIVHLFKKDLPTLKRKPSRVTVRIASPELSRYNTPEHNRMLLESIVHTSPANRISPPHHSRMSEASTRSVLDALKEISRKRIHASEDIDLNEEKKKMRMDCLDSKKRNRDPDSPPQENAVSPNNRLSKKVCAMNELKASYSSSLPDSDYTGTPSVKRKQSVAEISPRRKEAKQKNLVNAETQTTVPELTTTATNPEPEMPQLQQQPAEKSPEPNTVQELQKTNKPSRPVKVFDEKPLEMMRKNRLQVLMGTLAKDKPKRTTIEGYEARLNSISSDPVTTSGEKVEKEESLEPRTPEKQATPEKQLVSILSGPKKSPHKKHVTFNIPENSSSSSSGENLSFIGTTTPPKFISNCSVTQTSTAITTPIVSSGIASSPILSPPKESVNHGDDSAVQNLPSAAPQEKPVVPALTSPTITSSSSVLFSFGSPPAGEPSPAFKPNPVTIANITLPKSLDVTSGSSGKKVGGFKFDLNKVTPPAGFGGASNTETPSFGRSPEGAANFSFSPKQSSFASTVATTVILPLVSTPVATTSSFGGTAKTFSSSLPFQVPSTRYSSLSTNPSVVTFGGNAGNPPPAYGNTSSNSFGVVKGSSDNVFGNSTTTTTTSSFSSFGSGAPPAFGASTNTFGSSGNAATPSFGGTSNTATPSFGGNIAASPAFGNSTTTTSTAVFGTATTTTSAPSFGVTSATPSFGTATTIAPFGFGAASTTSFSGFGTTSTPSFGGVTSAPSFGAVATTAPSFGGASSTPSFAGVTTAASSFGATAAPPSFGTATTATPSFGSATTTTPSFGSATTTPSFGASSFGATTTAPPAYGSFGNTATTTSAFGSASTTAPPAFGSNFGPQAATTTSAPSFGGFGSSSAPKTFTFGSNAPSFGGGSSSSVTNPTFGTTVTSSSNFGTQSTPSFTGPAMSTPSFNFGTTSSTSTTTAAPSFGTANMFNSGTNSSFGINSKAPPSFGAAAGATPSGFGNTSASFGGGTNTNSSFSGFGGTPTTTAENKFGSSTAPFMFGSTNTSFNGGSSAFGAPTTTSSAFGGAPTTTPSFGQATPAPSFGTAVTTTASSFGAPSSTPSFSATANGFGSSTTFGNSTANPGFGSANATFGASAPSTGFGSGNASFGFGSTTPATTFGKAENGTGAFGQGGQGFGSATSAFNAPTTTQSGVFAFGSTANPPKPGAIFSFGSNEPPKPSFNFTGGAASSATTFGGSNSTAPNFAPPGGFGGTPTPGQFGGVPQPGPPGMFSIGTGSSTPNRARTQLKAKRRT